MRRSSTALAAGLALLAAAPTAGGQVPQVRDDLVIVGSASGAAVGQMLVGQFRESRPGQVDTSYRPLGSIEAATGFCAGAGPRHPDLAIVSRRMSRTMLNNCAENGVRGIVELRLGRGAVVLAVRRGEPTLSLATEDVWKALAADQVEREEFVPNRRRFWSDVSPGLPAMPIRVLVPAPDRGLRSMFDDLVMEAGCRHDKAIQLIFDAGYRQSRCVTLRDDGAVIEIPSERMPAALLEAPPGTMAVMTFAQLVQSGGNFVPLGLDGVVPSTASIASLEYEPTRAIYLYAKRAPGRPGGARDAARAEFLALATSEEAVGPGGFLGLLGLVPLSPAVRATQRAAAESLTPMSR
jgi:phosphate transport system substrate-binding protein